MLSSKTVIPLYKQVEDELYHRIQRKEYTAENRLPTEAELAKQFNVSTITIKKAILNLVEQGVLVRKQGKGTFVVSPKQPRELTHVIGFSESCRINGTTAGSKTLEQTLVLTPSLVKEALQYEEDYVICISRLRFVDDIPMAIETNWFPLEYNFLLKEDLDDCSLFDKLNERNVALYSARRSIEICHANREETQLLNVPSNTALLLVKSTAFSHSGEAIFYGKQVINSEHFKLIV